MTTHGKPPLLTPDQQNKIVKLREMGIGPTSLAKRFGVSVTTIYTVLTEQRDAKGGSQ